MPDHTDRHDPSAEANYSPRMSYSPARFAVEQDRLLAGDEVLLCGPVDHVIHFCDVLNSADPAEERVAPALRALLRGTRGVSFAPGQRLLSDGTPLNVLKRGRAEGAQ